MAWHDESQVVFLMCDHPHVVHRPCTASQRQGQDNVWENEIFVVGEKFMCIAHYQDAGLLDGFYQLLS